MPWLFGCLAIVFPRLALFLVWLFGGNYLDRAYGSVLLELLGFLFLPLTTLTYAYAHNSLGDATGHVSSLGWLLTAIALLIDVGIVGSHQRARRRARVL
ncbi:MAG TPA: hypothetical protein VFS67_31810 [Polyangiaceae bacterium]|jgi:hypothetical protein|nr:hypothetical protein [Polyangiaceae bacterium]